MPGIHQLADAVTRHLEGTTLEVPLVVCRRWIPDFEAADLRNGLRAVVIPAEVPERGAATRRDDHRTHHVDIAILEHVAGPHDLAKIDRVVVVADAVADLWKSDTLAINGVRITRVEHIVMLDHDMLRDKSVALSSIRLAILEARAR